MAFFNLQIGNRDVFCYFGADGLKPRKPQNVTLSSVSLS